MPLRGAMSHKERLPGRHPADVPLQHWPRRLRSAAGGLGSRLDEKDKKGRGCLQLAGQVGSKNLKMHQYLLEHIPDLPRTNAQGRPDAEKSRGSGAVCFRQQTGYQPQKGTWKRKGKEEGKGKRMPKCRGKGKGRYPEVQ